MSWLRKWTILIHRYLGIPFSVLFAVWFVSGIAMIYARGMPGLTPETRLERLPALDFSRVELSPAEAAEAAFLGGRPDGAVLLMVLDRPAYRFSNRGSVTVFADDGEVLAGLSPDDALAVADGFMGPGHDGRFEHRGVLGNWISGRSARTRRCLCTRSGRRSGVDRTLHFRTDR